jgi:hypothetical protein
LKRRTRWIIALSVGIPLLAVGTLLLILHVISPDPRSTLSTIERRELPENWTQSAPAEVSPDTSIPELYDAQDVALPPTIDEMGLPLSGVLVIEGNGRPFGEEAYTLRLEDEGVVLEGGGEFWFKVLVATVRVQFDQRLTLERDLRPQSLTSSFRAPLRFNREVDALLDLEEITVRTGDQERQYSIATDRVFVLNTFSTYAVIPLLFALDPLAEEMELETLMLGGPPRSEEAELARRLPVMRVRRREDGVLRSEERDLIVSRYELVSETGTMVLYARGVEFLGLFAGDDEQSLFVYRADFFPDGFEVVEGGDGDG